MISEYFLTEKFEIPKGVNVPPFANISKTSNFSVLELKRMFGRFCALSNSIGRVDKTAFLRQPELAFCSFADLAFDFEQEKTKFKVGPGETWPRGLDFVQFVNLLSEFSPMSPMENRVNYLFAILNVDTGTGLQAPVSPRAELQSNTNPDPISDEGIHRMRKSSFIEFTQRMHDDNMPDDVSNMIANDMWDHMILGNKTSKKRREKIQKLNHSLDKHSEIEHHNANDKSPESVGYVELQHHDEHTQVDEEYVTNKEFNHYLSSMDLFQLLTINF